MHLKHLPKSYLTAPLLLTLLAACGGGASGGTSVVNLFPESAGKPGANVVQPGQVKPEGSPNSGGAGDPGKQAGDQQGGNAGSANAGGRGDGAESAGQDPSGNSGAGNAAGDSTGNAGAGSAGGQDSSGTQGGSNGTGSNGSTSTPGGAADSTQGQLSISSRDCPLQYVLDRNPPAEKTGADPFRNLQWHLDNTGALESFSGMKAGEDLRVVPVWNAGINGFGVRVAVVDDGMLLMHEDLRANVVPGSHNYDPKGHPDYPVPCSTLESHGTEVAGVIAARNGNGVGLSGVAPHASLVGLNPAVTGQDSDTLNALTRDLDSNDIFNNSWGNEDSGHFYGYQNAAGFRAALNEGLEKGRKGRGSIYVFAGGNGALNGDYSVLDGYVAERGVVTVCASNAAGVRAFYSERGPNLTVCAPSAGASDEAELPSIATTTTGYEDAKEGKKETDLDGYTAGFNGTSAAAPMVSGVVALMLQAKPELTWRDVPLILARTARKVDEKDGGWKDYQSPINGLRPSWSTLHYSHHYGFGVVNAEGAVTLSRSWKSVGDSKTQKKCVLKPVAVNEAIPEAGILAQNADQNQGLPADARARLTASAAFMDYNEPVNDGVSSQLQVGTDCDIKHIEHIDVTVNTTNSNGFGVHTSPGDLHMTLQSPSGAVSTLTVPHGCSEAYTTSEGEQRFVTKLCRYTGSGFQFGVRRHLEEPVAVGDNRTWTLSVADRVSGHTGRLKDWSITFYGR